MSKALIVIDAQEDFTYGALGTVEAIEALPVITKAVEYATDNDMKIYYTRDTHDKSTYFQTQEGRNLPVEHCIKNTNGWRLCRDVLPRNFSDALIIEKKNFGTIRWNMLPELQNYEEIWICGFCTDICVMANFQIIKVLFPEVSIVIIEDACAGTTPETHKAALEVMRQCQAKILSFDDAELLDNK